MKDIIKSLSKKDLLLLSAYVDSQRKTALDIHRRFNKKLEKENQEKVGEDITRHRLKYLEVLGLLRSELNRYGRVKGKGIDIIFSSNFSDLEFFQELQSIGIALENIPKENINVGNHEEAVEKLDLLLKDEAPKKGWQYLINKK